MIEHPAFPVCETVQSSAESTLAFAELADDFNPLHIDPDFAATSPFGETILHGAHVLTLLLDLVERHLPDDMALHDVQVRFIAPVPVGTLLFLHLTTEGGGPEHLTLRCDDGAERLFIKGSARFGPRMDAPDEDFNGAKP